MLADVTRDQSCIEIVGARRRIADDDVDCLAAVEGLKRLGMCDCWSQQQNCGNDSGKCGSGKCSLDSSSSRRQLQSHERLLELHHSKSQCAYIRSSTRRVSQ